ncbi:hypothetical protein BC940DRAFT_310988 [Gongronella butleri]|nr:hypothetical protein BC940DRAFT_310988 [Gongronella butleri]
MDEIISPAMLSRSSSRLTATSEEDDAKKGKNDEDDDEDWSDRDLIPIPLKATSKLNVGSSPLASPGLHRRRNSMPALLASPHRHSRRSSVSSTRSSVSAHRPAAAGDASPVYPPPPPSSSFAMGTWQHQHLQQQQRSLFAGSPMLGYKQTPYTSAAATPTAAEFERDYYFDEPENLDENDEFAISDAQEDTTWAPMTSIFMDYSIDNALKEASRSAKRAKAAADVQPSSSSPARWRRYSFSSSLRKTGATASSSSPSPSPSPGTSGTSGNWDPAAALANLKQATQRIITGKQLQHALAVAAVAGDASLSTLDMQDPASPAPSVSPTTPTMSSLKNNLSDEIAAAKEAYRQELRIRHHAMAQPAMAQATHLEVELDMSKSTLLHRRHTAVPPIASSSTPAPLETPLAAQHTPLATPLVVHDAPLPSESSETLESPQFKKITETTEIGALPIDDPGLGPSNFLFGTSSSPIGSIPTDPEQVIAQAREKLAQLTGDAVVTTRKITLASTSSTPDFQKPKRTASSSSLERLSQYSFPPTTIHPTGSPRRTFSSFLSETSSYGEIDQDDNTASKDVSAEKEEKEEKEADPEDLDCQSTTSPEQIEPMSAFSEEQGDDNNNQDDDEDDVTISHLSSVSSMTSLPSILAPDDDDENDDELDDDDIVFLSAVASAIVSESDTNTPDFLSAGSVTPVGFHRMADAATSTPPLPHDLDDPHWAVTLDDIDASVLRPSERDIVSDADSTQSDRTPTGSS